MLEKSNMKDALLQWSICNAKELEAWSSGIKVLDSFPYFKGLKSKFPFSYKIIMYFFDFSHANGIIHLKFI